MLAWLLSQVSFSVGPLRLRVLFVDNQKEYAKLMSHNFHAGALALCSCLIFGLIAPLSARHVGGHTLKPATPKDSGVSAGVKRAIQSAYNEQNVAFSRQDIEGYLAHRATDYVLVDEDGEGAGQDKLRHGYGMMFHGTKASVATTTILSASSEAGGVVVLTREHLQLTVIRPGDQKVGHLVADNRNRDFWVQGQGGWQEKRTKQLSSKQTNNGQPIP